MCKYIFYIHTHMYLCTYIYIYIYICMYVYIIYISIIVIINLFPKGKEKRVRLGVHFAPPANTFKILKSGGQSVHL